MLRSTVLLATVAAFLAATPAPPPFQESGTTTYDIDPVHSSVVFRVLHMGIAPFYGRFNDLAGTIVHDPANPENSSVKIEIEAESVDTGAAARDRHLRSPDFFNAKQFPKITFESTGVKKTGDGTFEVTGDLTLLGRTRPVTLTVERTGEGNGPRGKPRIGFATTTSIRRSEFGMTYMLDEKKGVGDRVDLFLAVEGVRR
jgi:polyisoprenoid-binding protein YceI